MCHLLLLLFISTASVSGVSDDMLEGASLRIDQLAALSSSNGKYK